MEKTELGNGINVRILHRTYVDGDFFEQIHLFSGNVDPNLSISELVAQKCKSLTNYNITFVYEGHEVNIVDSIEIDGIIEWNKDIKDIKLKWMVNSDYSDKIIIYVNDENAVGSDGGLVTFIEICRDFFQYLGIFTAIIFLFSTNSKILKPFVVRNAANRKTEWDIDDFKKAFQIDEYCSAKYALFVCGFKKDKKTGKYRNKFYKPKLTILTNDGYNGKMN